MTLHFKEANKYLIDYGVASSIILVCTYVEDNTVWFETLHKDALYKYDKKTNKLYVFNTKVQAWDSVEGSLSEEGVVAKYKPEDVTVIYDYLE